MTTTAAPTRTRTSRLPVATIVTAAVAIHLQLLAVLNTVLAWFVLAFGLPEGWGPVLVSRDDLADALREWAARGVLGAACVAAIVVAVGHHGRDTTLSVRAALAVSVAGLAVGLSGWRIDLSQLTSSTW